MTARMCWTSMPKGRALEGVGIVCREPELARDTVRVVWFRSSRHTWRWVRASHIYGLLPYCVVLRHSSLIPCFVIDRTAFYEDRKEPQFRWTLDVPGLVGLCDVEHDFWTLVGRSASVAVIYDGVSPKHLFSPNPSWVGSALSVCVCLSILRACVRSQDLELGRQPRLRVLRHLSTMMHGKATSEISRDESICRECGGWLGRKPGMKPWCSLASCPGRTAPKDDSTSVPAKPSAPPQPRPPPTPPHRSEAAATRTAPPAQRRMSKDSDDDPAPRSAPTRGRPPSARQRVFINPSQDEEEEAGIRSKATRIDSPRLSFMGIIKGLPKPGLLMLAIAWLWGGLLTQSDAPWNILGIIKLSPSEKFVMLFTSTFLIAAYPFSEYFLFWMTAPRFQRIRWVVLGHLLSVISSIGILFLVVEPYIPPPGGLAKSEICIDWVSRPPAIRFDSSRVMGGPCFRLAIETIEGR